MKGRKVPLIVCGGWQLLRFAVITLGVILYLNPALFAGSSLFIVWPAAPSLALSAAYFLAGSRDKRFGSLRGLLVIGKVLDIFPGLLLLLLQGAALYFDLAKPVFDRVRLIDELSGNTAPTELFFYYGLAVVVLVDLIFLLILLSYRSEPEKLEPAPGENLPEFEITQIEED